MNSRTCLALSRFKNVGKLNQSRILIPRIDVNPFYVSSAVRLKDASNQNDLKATEISSLPKKKLAVRFVESFPLGAQPYLRVARVDRPIGKIHFTFLIIIYNNIFLLRPPKRYLLF